jgi:phage terminase small subunit
MPRKSVAALSVVGPLGLPNRLHPPSSLSTAERKAFLDIVGACDPNKFHPSDIALLCRYAEAIALAERAARELRKSPVLKGKLSPWVTVQEKAVRAIVSLSLRLRLSPQARAPNNPGNRPRALSHYDKMRLENDEE